MTINISDEESLADYDLDPSFPVDPEETPVEPHTEAKGAVQNVNSRIVGYHFAGLHFYPGIGGVKDVWVGDPGIPGVLSVKVLYKTPGKRHSIFTVPSTQFILEEEELAVAIVHGDLGVGV